MFGVQGTRPCGTCGGKGVVVVKGADGKDVQQTCPACNGSQKAGELRKK